MKCALFLNTCLMINWLVKERVLRQYFKVKSYCDLKVDPKILKLKIKELVAKKSI